MNAYNVIGINPVEARDRQIADDLEMLCDPYDTSLHIAVMAYAVRLRGEGE